jgi:PilZ domain
MNMEATARTLTTSAGFDGDERRSDQRHRVLKGGTLYFNKGYSSLECVIRDLSATGARIQMGETFGVPTRFTMSISGETTRIEASLRWRTSRNIGLSFLLRSN